MQQARMILAVVLSMAVFFVYYTYIDPPQKPVASPVAANPSSQPLIQDTSVAKVVEVNPTLPDLSAKGEEFVLENDSVKIVVDSIGGQIESVFLKKYATAENDEWVNLVTHNGGLGGLSFSNTLKDFNVPYSRVSVGDQEIVLEGTLNNLALKKTYRLSPTSPYGFEQEIEMTNKGDAALDVEPQFWMVRHQKDHEQKSGFFSFLAGPPDIVHPSALVDTKVSTETDPKKINRFGPLMGDVSWLAFSDRYFMTSFISRQTSQASLGRFLTPDDHQLYASFTYGSLSIAPKETITKKVGLYLGPKLRSQLKLFGVGLEKSVDYGWFSFVAVPLLWLLIFFEKLIGNWGLAIILLTFVVKLILHPINQKSMQSMKAMQKLQPRLKEIQQKYKGNREKLNSEMMLMFKSHNVNPMGGCLPMILQMPIYIALYKVLWNAIELYKVPFFGIYKDLSAPDPYFIGPILLGVLFFLQQKFTPTSATVDPAQQKIMQFMPMMFTVFMVFLPAGLILYIFVNTLMSVIQQYMIHREISFWDLMTGKRPA